MPAHPPYLIEPIWQQFSAPLPEREVDHPQGCHRPRIPDLGIELALPGGQRHGVQWQIHVQGVIPLNW